MVMLGYMKYLEDRNNLVNLTNEFGGVEIVFSKPSLIRKVVSKFNIIQESKRDSELNKFCDSYINGEYGLKHPGTIERIDKHAALKTWYSTINYKEAKEMLKEYNELEKEPANQ